MWWLFVNIIGRLFVAAVAGFCGILIFGIAASIPALVVSALAGGSAGVSVFVIGAAIGGVVGYIFGLVQGVDFFD
jgi:hypothetical protein